MNDDDKAAARISLSVIKGLHAGAALDLTLGAHLIGCDDHCDIVLTDRGMAGEHLLLTVSHGGAAVHALAAGVDVDERALAVGERLALTPEARLRIGYCVIAIGGGRADHVPAINAAVASTALATRIQPRPLSRHLGTALASCAAVAFGLGLAMQVSSRNLADAAHASDAQSARAFELMARAIGDFNLHEVRPKSDSSGAFVLEGYVPNQSIYHELRRRFAHTRVRTSLVSVDELLRFSRELLAQRGFDADLSYDGNGILSVGGADADAPGFEAAVLALPREVPGLRSARALVREPRGFVPLPQTIAAPKPAPPAVAPPLVAPPELTRPAKPALPNYVLSGVNSINAGGDSPYLSNGKHFVFTGGTLKNGMTVRAIQTDRITLDEGVGRRLIQIAVR